jgi:hypothetical protein
MLLVGAFLAAACGGNNSLRGFPESEVTSPHAKPEVLEGCQARSGRLVIEVESVLVREYPNFGTVPKGHGQRPFLIVTLESPTANRAGAEAAVLMAPAGYQPGEYIEYFSGRRILERPFRYLAHRRLTVRLLENDSTSPPEWVEHVQKLKTVSPAGALVGLNVPGAAIADGAWLLAQLDPDDLIMLYGLDLEPVMTDLGAVSDRRALRLKAATPRRINAAKGSANPVAEMGLLAYLEPEPGCP